MVYSFKRTDSPSHAIIIEKGWNILNILIRRLPQRGEILSVFGVVVFAVHSWSVRGFLYQAPAYSLYYSIGEMFFVFSYMMAFALLESVLITLLLVVPAVILPSKLLKEGFAYKGFLAVLVASAYSIWLQNTLGNLPPPSSLLLNNAGIAVGAFVLLAILFQLVGFLQKIVINLAERMGIMAYLYVPLGLIGILVFISRSLFHLIQRLI